MGRHLGADEIYQLLLDAGEEIGLATVYRVLSQFETAGLVTRHNFEDSHSVFERSSDDHHDHMVDIESGEVVRKARDSSFSAAMGAMTENLTVELDQFQDRIQQDPQVAQTQWKPDHGGGTFGMWILIVLALLAGTKIRRHSLFVKVPGSAHSFLRL